MLIFSAFTLYDKLLLQTEQQAHRECMCLVNSSSEIATHFFSNASNLQIAIKLLTVSHMSLAVVWWQYTYLNDRVWNLKWFLDEVDIIRCELAHRISC